MNQHADIAGPLSGKVAVVTGSSAGNGRAIALRLARDGAAVVCADLAQYSHAPDFDGAEATDSLIRSEGGRATWQQVDVANGGSVGALYEHTLATYGRLDIVVANAGISPQPPVHLPEESYETFRRVTAVNQEGAWWTAREGTRILRDQKEGGRVIFLSSIAGLVGTDSGAHYCMSKGAINQLTRALAFQFAQDGITVNAIAPGFIRTSMTAHYLSDPEQRRAVLDAHPLGRVGETTDVAGAASFLAGPDSSWITGVVLPVDGGYTAI